MAYEIRRFPYPGTIDADGHILEPPDLWENYLEAKWKPRALRIGVDARGYEYLEIDGKPSQRSRHGSLGLLGAMGDEDMTPRPDRRYAENIPMPSAIAAIPPLPPPTHVPATNRPYRVFNAHMVILLCKLHLRSPARAPRFQHT